MFVSKCLGPTLGALAPATQSSLMTWPGPVTNARHQQPPPTGTFSFPSPPKRIPPLIGYQHICTRTCIRFSQQLVARLTVHKNARFNATCSKTTRTHSCQPLAPLFRARLCHFAPAMHQRALLTASGVYVAKCIGSCLAAKPANIQTLLLIPATSWPFLSTRC